jgi:hypothetical protein
LSGQSGDMPYGCSVNLMAKMSKPVGARSSVDASVQVSCLGGAQSCTAHYTGSGRRR